MAIFFLQAHYLIGLAKAMELELVNLSLGTVDEISLVPDNAHNPYIAFSISFIFLNIPVFLKERSKWLALYLIPLSYFLLAPIIQNATQIVI